MKYINNKIVSTRHKITTSMLRTQTAGKSAVETSSCITNLMKCTTSLVKLVDKLAIHVF